MKPVPLLSATYALLILFAACERKPDAIITSPPTENIKTTPTKVVTAFLDAAISHADPTVFLAPGTDAKSVTQYDATSYEIKNISGDVVSVVVHFKGTQTHSKPSYTALGNLGPG